MTNPIGQKVLIIEDNVIAQKLIQLLLDDQGFITNIASNGTHALELISKNHYKLILLDINLPDIDGFTLAKLIRSKENYLNIIKKSIIIGMSASSSDKYAKLLMDSDINKFIEKPLTKESLNKITSDTFN
ncbi:response regulator [bacterium SCSIO 12844]|nr:response regulator [bacterium SCSIO 12844]